MEIRGSISRTNETLILVSFPVAVMNCSNKKNLREKGVILGYFIFNSFFLGLSVDLFPEMGGAFWEATLPWILLCDNELH